MNLRTLFAISSQNTLKVLTTLMGVGWPCGRASDSESRGPGFDPHMRHHFVSLSKTHFKTPHSTTGKYPGSVGSVQT